MTPFGVYGTLRYCIVFIHFYSASHSLSLSEVLPTTAIDTVSEFTRRSVDVKNVCLYIVGPCNCHPLRMSTEGERRCNKMRTSGREGYVNADVCCIRAQCIINTIVHGYLM